MGALLAGAAPLGVAFSGGVDSSTLLALAALWNVFSAGHPWRWIMLATLGAALALTGPGAWSLDARLFGWKRLDLRTRKSDVTPP